MPDLITITEAAERLGTDRNRIATAVHVLDIPTHRIRLNGNAKMIDTSYLDLLKQKLASRPTAKASA